jgi:hypothetical protein
MTNTFRTASEAAELIKARRDELHAEAVTALAFERDQRMARLYVEAFKTAVVRARGPRCVTISLPDRRAGRLWGSEVANLITDVFPAPGSAAAASLSLHQVSPVEYHLVW